MDTIFEFAGPFIEFVKALPLWVAPAIRVVVGLVFLDIVLGIAKAIRTKAFDFTYLADFYRTMVLPYLVGYLGLIVAAWFVGDAMLPDPYGMVFSNVIIGLGWVALVGTLARSIWKNIYFLYKGIPEWEFPIEALGKPEEMTFGDVED